MPKALNNEVHALLSEAKKLENSEIVLGRSLKGYDSTFTLPQESIRTVNKSFCQIFFKVILLQKSYIPHWKALIFSFLEV